MEEAVVYCKELIKAGLDADTQTPAGMRHRFSKIQQDTFKFFEFKASVFKDNIQSSRIVLLFQFVLFSLTMAVCHRPVVI